MCIIYEQLWVRLDQFSAYTVNLCKKGYSKIEKTKILLTNDSLIGHEKPFVIFLRVAVLHRFYCTEFGFQESTSIGINLVQNLRVHIGR